MVPELMKTLRKHLKSSDFIQKNFRRYVEPMLPVSEPELYLLRQMSFRSVLDVGANVGVYSVWLSRISNRIWSFEPLDYPLHVLRVLSLPNVKVMPFALGDKSGKQSIFIPRSVGRSEHPLASLSQTEFADFKDVEAKTIEVRRFDDLQSEISAKDIDFVKIDVEGFELQVLRGMSELIRGQHPLFLIEIEARHNKSYQEVFEFLSTFGYRPFYTKDGKGLQQTGPDQIAKFQSKQNFDIDVKTERKFKVGDQKSYINNFFFLTRDHETRWKALLG